MKKTSQNQTKRPSPKDSFGIFCLGCPQNEYDAGKISQFLTQRGYRYSNCDQATSIIILSCSVRQSAIDRVWEKLRDWIKAGKRIFVIGCVLEKDKRKFRAKYPQLTILSTEKFFKKPPLFQRPNPKKRTPLRCRDGLMMENKKRHRRYPKNHAFVPIQFGCDNFCTYCAVPYTRGREKSRPAKEIIEQIKNLVVQGKTYITLIGQNVNSYGLSKEQKQRNVQSLRKLTKERSILKKEERRIKDNPTPSFSQLLNRLEKIPGLERLDFLSPNPQDMTDKVVEWMGKSKIFSKKLNLPLQSGSDRILKRMNRRYTAKQYLELVKKIRREVPDIQLTTDVIVGFSEETKEDFNKTFNLCRRIGFRQIYIARYSPRAGTVAERFFKDDISWKEKKRRWKKINSLIA
jgi:tRNA-2-methylthio-N6-dimethylallyladenosine synthase